MQEQRCPLLCTWPLTVQELVWRRQGCRRGPMAPFVSSSAPQTIRVLSGAAMISLCSVPALVPLCLCPCVWVSLSLSLCPSLPVPLFVSPPPTLPCPCCSVLFFLGCRCSRLVPLRFWSQPKPSLPWRDGNVPRKVSIFLGSVLKRGCPGAWRSGGLSRVQTPGCIHGGIFFPSFSVPCSYVCVVLSLPQRKSTETGVCL